MYSTMCKIGPVIILDLAWCKSTYFSRRQAYVRKRFCYISARPRLRHAAVPD